MSTANDTTPLPGERVSLLRELGKYFSIFRIQAANRLAYPLDLVIGSLSILMFMWIFLQLWKATYASAGQTTIAGFSIPATLWYLMISETVVLSRPRLWRPISESVKDGSIAYVLNKPYNFLLYHASMGLGDGLLATLFNLILGGALVWLLVGPPPAASGWLYASLAIFFAWWIEFCFSALIGLAAFATEEVAAFDWIYSKILFIFGGLLVPLDFYPAWLQTIARFTPFAYTVYGPARLFVAPSLPAFLSLIGQQLIWLVVMGSIVVVVYRIGVRRLVINGG